MTTLMVVILQNISSDMMFYLHDHISQILGVLEILLASPKVIDTGRYSILVQKSLFTHVWNILNKSLATLISADLPQDAQPMEFQFPGPARVKPLYTNGNSSGENTWMTASYASFMFMDLPKGHMDDFLHKYERNPSFLVCRNCCTSHVPSTSTSKQYCNSWEHKSIYVWDYSSTHRSWNGT
jgi:hypothetical protein